MSGEEEGNIGESSLGQVGDVDSPEEVGRTRVDKNDQARARVENLASSIPPETIADGKAFNELPLYEKKSALIDRELE
jgi:hypothetical protein